MRGMRYLSLFSGIGGFELGIEQAYENNSGTEPAQRITRMPRGRRAGGKAKRKSGPVCIGFSEIDPYAIQIYKNQFPSHTNYGDITKVNAASFPAFDCLVGGFPCQSFSIAGKRAGFRDTRGTLFFDIARVLETKRPRLLCLENVKGLFSHDGGRTFATIVRALDELGYDLQWQLLNSKDFGVPQNRERVFIVGHLRGTSRPEVFPFTADDSKIEKVRSSYRDANSRNNKESQRRAAERRAVHIATVSDDSPRRKSGPAELHTAYTLRASHDQSASKKHPKNFVAQRPHGFFKGSKNDHAPSIRGSSVANNVFVNNIRRLTPIECERLQGFPDGWTKYGQAQPNSVLNVLTEISDTQRYKTLGNAVTVNVVRAIMERIL